MIALNVVSLLNKQGTNSSESKEANSIFILQDAEMEEDQIHYMAILMSL